MPINNVDYEEQQGSAVKEKPESRTVRENRVDGFSIVGSPRVPDMVSNSEHEDSDDWDDDFSSAPKLGGTKKLLIGVAAGVLLLVVILFVVISRPSGGSSGVSAPPSSTAPEINQTPVVSPKVSSSPEVTNSVEGTNAPTSSSQVTEAGSVSGNLGMQDLTGDNMTNDTKPLDPSLYIKDVDGLTLSAQYTVDKIETIRELVNYKKMRGQIGVGFELLWLDVTYKDEPYVIQVPFSIFKELDDVGIVLVDMEVLRIKVGGDTETRTVISSMQVVPNFKALMSKKK